MADVNNINIIKPVLPAPRDSTKKINKTNRDSQHKESGDAQDEPKKDEQDESSGHVDEYV